MLNEYLLTKTYQNNSAPKTPALFMPRSWFLDYVERLTKKSSELAVTIEVMSLDVNECISVNVC